jgi:hypothetical protein
MSAARNMRRQGERAAKPPRYLSVCGLYQNEARYLREWIEFHRLVGVERFYLYDNLSTDGHLDVLAPYLEDGIVELADWPEMPAQMAVYQDCLLRHRDESQWIAFIDVDEFLFSPTGRPLSELLVEYERWPGVGVNWAMFGANGHRTPVPGLVIEQYVRRAADEDGLNLTIKSIVQPRQVRNFCNPHFFMYKDGLAVDENMEPITGPPFGQTDSVSFSRLRLNHYATKSEQEFRGKLERPGVFALRARDDPETITLYKGMPEDMLMRRLAKLDLVEDQTILRYLPALKRALDALERRSPASTVEG